MREEETGKHAPSEGKVRLSLRGWGAPHSLGSRAVQRTAKRGRVLAPASGHSQPVSRPCSAAGPGPPEAAHPPWGRRAAVSAGAAAPSRRLRTRCLSRDCLPPGRGQSGALRLARNRGVGSAGPPGQHEAPAPAHVSGRRQRVGSGGAPAEKAGSLAGPPTPAPPRASHTPLQPCTSIKLHLPVTSWHSSNPSSLAAFFVYVCLFT